MNKIRIWTLFTASNRSVQNREQTELHHGTQEINFERHVKSIRPSRSRYEFGRSCFSHQTHRQSLQLGSLVYQRCC